MKILAFTDYHENENCLASIKKKASDADILICCGDFTMFGGNIEKQLLALNKIGKPVLLIPGNHEEDEPVEEICQELENVHNIDRALVTLEEYMVFGYGGGGFSKQDKNLEKLIPKLKKDITKPLIMITHAPPYKTKLDKLDYFGNVGNKSITKAIKELKPQLFLCGHLHEHFTERDVLGTTFLLNPGPEGMLINIDEKKKEKNKIELV